MVGVSLLNMWEGNTWNTSIDNYHPQQVTLKVTTDKFSDQHFPMQVNGCNNYCPQNKFGAR